MGFIDNKYVSKFINGPTLPTEFRQHAASAPETSPSLPAGWSQRWDPNNQRWYYLEHATGNTQLEPPPFLTQSHNDAASTISGATTLHENANASGSANLNPAVPKAHAYTNMPTAAERDAIWEKERKRQEKEGDAKKYVCMHERSV